MASIYPFSSSNCLYCCCRSGLLELGLKITMDGVHLSCVTIVIEKSILNSRERGTWRGDNNYS